MPTSAWLVGSIPSVPQQTITVTANAVATAIAIPAGDYYVFDRTASLSAINAFATAVLSHSQIDEVNVNVASDGTIDIEYLDASTPRATQVVWTSGTEIRDLLGSTGNLASNSQHALAHSRYLWVPGRGENVPKSRLGSQGWYVYDTAIAESGTSEMMFTRNNAWRENEFEFPHVVNSRVWTPAEAGGEYFQFFDRVLSRGRRWKLYRESPYDSDGSYGTVFSTDGTDDMGEILGPYKLTAERGHMHWNYKRTEAYREFVHPIEISGRLVSEYA